MFQPAKRRSLAAGSGTSLHDRAQIAFVAGLVLLALSNPRTTSAQQVFADGTVRTATGVVDMGTINGDAGIGLRARNAGTILTLPPLSVTTGGVSAIGAQALSGSRIDLVDGTTIHTTGLNADGIVSSGNSLVTVSGTSVFTEQVGYGLIAGTGGRIEFADSDVNALTATGAAVFSGGTIRLVDSTVQTGTGIGLWIDGAASNLIGDGFTVMSTAARGALVSQGTLSLSDSSITSSGIGIQTGNAAKIYLDGTSVSTTGVNAYGVYLSGGSVLSMTGGSITTAASGARGLYGGPGANAATINGATITTAQSSAILAFGAGAVLDVDLAGSNVVGAAAALEIGGGGILDLDASRSEITGRAVTAVGSSSSVTLSDGSTWNVTGTSNVTDLTNDASLVQFSPAGNVFKSLTTTGYAGADGRLGLNTYLGSDGSPSDLFVIDGGVASGTTGLIVRDTTGGGDLTMGNGILVVDTINGGTTDAGAFHLAAPVVAGPYEYSLYRSSLDGSGPANWYLRSILSPDPPGPDPTPDYRPEVSLYASVPSMAAIYGRHMIDTLHERVGEEEQLAGRTFDPNASASGVWLRGIGHWGHRNGDPRGVYDGAPEFYYRFGAMQGGLDLYRDESGGTSDRAGVYLAYGHGVMDVTQNRITTSRDAGRNDFDAFSVGGYWTRFGDDGWYLDGVLQGTWYQMTTRSRRPTEIGFPDQSIDGVGIAASLEGGYPLDLGDGWQLEPQVQAVWQTIHMDDFNDAAADVRYNDLNSLAGRVGARISRTWESETATGAQSARLTTVWGRVNIWHEFTAKAEMEISSAAGYVPFLSDLDETWVEIGIGGTKQVSERTSIFGNLAFSTSMDGDNYAWNGKVGLRVNW